MQIRIFNIGLTSGIEEQEAMNSFLRGRHVLTVDKQYDTARGLWTFAVTYLDGLPPAESNPAQRSEKIDYREVLSPEEFERFSVLRNRRKEIATQEAIPAYAIFKNDELAEMAKLEDLSIDKMMTIKGINKSRAERYGAALLAGLEPQPPATQP